MAGLMILGFLKHDDNEPVEVAMQVTGRICWQNRPARMRSF